MGKIFCIMGKSATGKDTIYKKMLEETSFDWKRMIPYTTRPIRDGEVHGREYYFCKEEDVKRLEEEHRIVELREYDTIYGIWKYFTVNDETINLEQHNYLLIGTLESYVKIREYFGCEKTVPIYIEVEDGLRLERALKREKQQSMPKYKEMCRRFLADSEDFSEDNLKAQHIEKRYANIDFELCLSKVIADIQKEVGV